ncbi:hypothetical protein CC205_26745 [Pseudomonas savastanoi pv. nerii]|uniref:Inositol-1-monophosphatase n=1 Tax=Pseudomonas savastanoi pv. nerii TaxID=360921 RepID=A0AB73QBW4_PSESS|nr:inositol monophosphatase family protein [Pseudomonas savastanoi]PAB25205.1 hypothetical protein CC205_26745 [Pseudomonas savastanoi pv. nerii]
MYHKQAVLDLQEELIRSIEVEFALWAQREDAFADAGLGADQAITSNIDKALEDVCISVLLRSGLVKNVLSEEAGHISLDKDGLLLAYLDPLDGTTNAKLQIPFFAMSLCLTDLRNKSIYALVYNYATKDVFYAFDGHGSFLNGNRLRVSSSLDVSRSTILTSRPLSVDEQEFYQRLYLTAQRIRIISCPSLEICMVATGKFMAAIDYHAGQGLIHTHDVIAARLILEEAGGVLLDESGEKLNLRYDCVSTFNFFALNTQSNFRLFFES